MSAAVHQILIIFIAISCGFFLSKKKIITEQGTSFLSNLVVNFTLPLYLFSAITTADTGIDTSGVLSAVAMSLGMFLVSGLIALIFVPAIRAPKEDRGVFMFETMCGNVTYVGIPVCAAIFGSTVSVK